MADVSVRVEGASELRRSLRRAGQDLDDLKDANARAAEIVASHARATAPRNTGALAASVKSNRAAGKAVIRAGSARVPYAMPIHWGWPSRNIAPNPWISRAAIDSQPQWLPAYEQEVQRVADSVRGA